jgi:phage terminase large subunit
VQKFTLKISRKVFNPVFLPYLETVNRYEVFYGGAGSGKSVFVCQKKLYKCMKQKMNLLVVRDTADSNRNSTFSLFKQIINKWNVGDLFKIRETDMRIKCINGNEIIFAGLDDVERLKSITFESGELTDIWVEEASEVLEPDFTQLDIRLRGGKIPKSITISFNPIDINHWLKKRFFDNRPDNCFVLHTTYKDNKFLDAEYIKLLESFKDTDPYYYAVYCLGEWGVLGKTIFPAQIVQERLIALRQLKPLRKGFFAYDYQNEKVNDNTIKFVDDFETGYIQIYEDVQYGYPYVGGGDTAGEGSDWFTGQIINNASKLHVAALRHQFDEDLYAKQMYCLGKYYNYALLAIETNFSTYPVKELERLGYFNMFVREVEDSITKKVEKRYGFQTNKLTRPLVIAALVTIVREHPEYMNDTQTLEEMLTFVRNERGKAEAQKGAHDDTIMGLAIAYYASSQQTTTIRMDRPSKTPVQLHKEKLARQSAESSRRRRFS